MRREAFPWTLKSFHVHLKSTEGYLFVILFIPVRFPVEMYLLPPLCKDR